MKVFIFDLLPYDKHFDQYKATKYLPYPLPRDHYDPRGRRADLRGASASLGGDGQARLRRRRAERAPHHAARPDELAEHDGGGGAQRTKKLKFLILGNLLPMHNPLRIAEELAMADCMSRGRILSGFARGVPREYNVYDVPMAESRARFEEAVDIIMKAWTEPQFSHDGKYWSDEGHRDLAAAVSSSRIRRCGCRSPARKETIEWAGKHNFSAVMPDFKRGLTEDIVGYFAKQLAENGHAITPEHLCFFTDAYRRRRQAPRRSRNTARSTSISCTRSGTTARPRRRKPRSKTSGYVSSSSFDYMREENRSAAGLDREKMKAMTHGRRREADRRRAAGLRQRQARHRQADRRRRALRRQLAAAEDERRRHAEGRVPQAAPPLRQGGAAAPAGASGANGAGGGLDDSGV